MVKFTTTLVLGLAFSYNPVHAFTSYIAQFMRVNYTVNGGWSASTKVAQQEIVEAAEWFAAQGPWSVMNKTILAPSNDTHDYLSWSPYWWADCSNVGNTTALTDQQVYTECNYVNRDGQFSPDVRLVNDTGAFQAMSDAVFYNVLAYKITGQDKYANDAVRFVDTWFINNATYMNPNLNYAQVIRGVNGTGGGSHTGVLDLHHITKVTSAILVLKAMGAPMWTPAFDAAMNTWTTQYVNWLQTAEIALQEKAATNNHGSFYFAQTASLQVLTGNYTGAKDTLNQYFNGIYKNQIVANGEQPLEASRTRPYHYRAYNAAALITIHRVAEYIGWDTWNITTTAGTTVKDAVDFTMTVPPGNDDPTELFPDVAAIASQYGDANGKYAAFLAQKDPTYPGEAYFFWEQPLSDSGIKTYIDSTGAVQVGEPPANNTGNGSGNSSHHSGAGVVTSPIVLAALSALVGGAGALLL
ncbi:hypothetical protein FRB99_002982 [Tulasnella sp. 403]|nr:hypothetical protein FRB99_002982 [Tulasnella sp. 403]